MTGFILTSNALHHASRRQVTLTGARLLLGWLAASAIGPARSLAQSADEATAIIHSLAPVRGQTISPGYRPQRREAVQVERSTIHVDVARSVSLEVYFEYDSARITRGAMLQLAALGRALSSAELAPYRYLVAGHTDATGADAYNLDLSRRRALAVRDYLVSSFPIDPPRLTAVGFGFRRLKRPDAPCAAINRRVEVLLVVP